MLNNLLINLRSAWQRPRYRWALLAAGLSDLLGFGVLLLPPLQWLLDAVTAVALWALLGFRWPLLLALAIEVVPVLELFPAWTLVIAALAATDKPPQASGTGEPQDPALGRASPGSLTLHEARKADDR